jgi:hypothetical protein
MNTPTTLAAVFAVDWPPVVGAICGLFAIGVIVLVVAGPRVREEGPLDEEVETRLLLGEDPEEIERDLEEREEETAPVSDLRPEE